MEMVILMEMPHFKIKWLQVAPGREAGGCSCPPMTGNDEDILSSGERKERSGARVFIFHSYSLFNREPFGATWSFPTI